MCQLRASDCKPSSYGRSVLLVTLLLGVLLRFVAGVSREVLPMHAVKASFSTYI